MEVRITQPQSLSDIDLQIKDLKPCEPQLTLWTFLAFDRPREVYGRWAAFALLGPNVSLTWMSISRQERTRYRLSYTFVLAVLAYCVNDERQRSLIKPCCNSKCLEILASCRERAKEHAHFHAHLVRYYSKIAARRPHPNARLPPAGQRESRAWERKQRRREAGYALMIWCEAYG